MTERDDTDHWEQPVVYDDREEQSTGAGARRQCSRCGSRHNVVLIGGTDHRADGDDFEEYYECRSCGAEGTYCVEDGRERWIGRIGSPDDGPALIADGGFEIEREYCGRCDGTGQITEAVTGRSGVVSCPDCGNVPEFVIPNDPPDDPETRLAEIEERRDELTEKKDRAQELRSAIHEARDLLSEAASSDLVPDDTGPKFDHLTDQIEMLLRSFDVARGIYYEQDQLVREKNEVQTLLKYATKGESQ